jgi:A/G-specific adenine glycosylase
MDLGATICTPTSPKCNLCPVNDLCLAKEKGMTSELPRKKAKKTKPQKYGQVYWIKNDQKEVLFVRRKEQEMLGGMLGLPTSEWDENQVNSKSIGGLKSNKLRIKHSFTHFDLILDVFVGKYDKIRLSGMIPPSNHHYWMSSSEIEKLGLPTLFKKVVKLMK